MNSVFYKKTTLDRNQKLKQEVLDMHVVPSEMEYVPYYGTLFKQANVVI